MLSALNSFLFHIFALNSFIFLLQIYTHNTHIINTHTHTPVTHYTHTHTQPSHYTQLRELEKERIAELGTSMTKSQEIEPERRRRMASRAGDLLSSSQLNKATGGSVRGRRENKGDYG